MANSIGSGPRKINAKGKRGLTDAQEKFCVLYVTVGRPGLAFRAAYPNSKMSDHSVQTEVTKMVRIPHIHARIVELAGVADAKLKTSVETIAAELARIANFDPGELVDDKGETIPLEKLPRDVRRAIAGMDIEKRVFKDGSVVTAYKYKFVSKMDALNTQARWKKMLIDRIEVGAPGEFDHLTDEQLEAKVKAEQQAMDAIDKAQQSSGKVLQVKAPKKAGAK